jgi:6,7-dimethyl-8-ribityllumazine synthase
MASALKNLSAYDEKNIPDIKGLKFGVVVSEWNNEITHALYQGCFDTLIMHGATQDDIKTIQVPGAFELPGAAKMLASSDKLDAVICIGCVIQGETKHNDYINHAVATGLTTLNIATGIPFIYGVLTPNDEQQAKDRAGGKYGNKGTEAAVTAIRMASIKKYLSEPKSKIGF